MKLSKIPLSVALAEIVWNWKIVWKYSGKMETKTKTGGYENVNHNRIGRQSELWKDHTV